MLNEVAPPTKKHERMVKHIKKSYAKKGGLSDEEKSIAYATAWKNYNKKESFEIDKSAHKKAQRKSKMRNLARGNENPNEKAAAEKKAGGPKLIGEKVKGQDTEMRKAASAERRSGETKPEPPSRAKANVEKMTREIRHHDKITKRAKIIPGSIDEGKNWKDFKSAIKSVVKKKDAPKHKYPTGASGGDAGRKAKERLDQREREKYVSPFKPVHHENKTIAKNKVV